MSFHHTVPVALDPEEQAIDTLRIRGGEASRAAFEHLLGLKEAPDHLKVQIVVWYDDHIEVLLGPQPKAPSMVLTIKDNKAGERAWVATKNLALSYKGIETIDESVDAAVSLHAPTRLGDATLEDLLAKIQQDPEISQLPTIRKYLGRQVEDLLNSWAGTGAYAEFFASGEIQRGQLDSVDLSGSFRFVQHCDNECLQVSPHGVAPLISLVEYPWDNRTKSFDLPIDKTPLDPGVNSMVTTDLNEHDVIMGNPGLVREVLDHVVATTEDKDKITFFSNTCVPMVTGEDVESVVRQTAKESGISLVYLTVTPFGMFNVFKDLLEARRLTYEAQAPAPDPNMVNLIGFAKDEPVAELKELLAQCGITVNAHLIPTFSSDRIRALPKAAVSVMYPNNVWDNHYQHLTSETRTTIITPEAPFGFEATNRWVKAVAKAVDQQNDVDEVLENAQAKLLERWQALREQAANYRIAIVVRVQELALLTYPSRTWGIPLIAFLEEAGFGLDIFIKVDQREAAREAAKTVLAQFEHPQRHIIKAFNSFELLRQRLNESKADAVLSYHFFDWRVSEAGKNRLSLQVFEMGHAGAIRTLERIIGICKTPFYRRYQKWLARTPEGLRVE